MALVTANDVAVLDGSTIYMPLIGVWTADLVLDQPDGKGFDAGTSVKIKAPDFELDGVVATDRTGDFLDAVHIRVIGGKGGMAKDVSLKAYVQPGAFVKDVVNGIASDAGETVSDTADQDFLNSNLTAWAVMNGLCSQALEMLIFIVAPSKHWRILADGTLWIGDETWPDFTGTFEIIASDPTERTTILGVESPSIKPGVTLQDVGKVSRVEHVIGSGYIRTKVETFIDQTQRGIVASIQALVRQETAGIDYQAFYQFRVQSQSADLTTVDVQPVPPNDSRFSGLSKVPVRMGTAVKVQFVQNATVMLGWDGGDPRSPYVTDGLSSESVQRIQIAGNTDAARKGDDVTAGATMATWIADVGTALNTLGEPVTAPTDFGTITGGSSLVGLG